jgi:hypothetical protein
MESLQQLIHLATTQGLLSPLNNRASTLRASLYADDAAVFVNPTKGDISIVAEILELFGRVSGLVTNRSKCAVYPIQCEGIDLSQVMEGFACPISSFPCTYLGLPLHYKHLREWITNL